MEMDAELINDFVAEIKLLETDLTGAVVSLRSNVDQPAQFEKFAQVIDRIYGTAATFGFTELAAYCGMLKKTCYNCAKSTNKRAQPKVLALLETCLKNLEVMIAGIHDPEATKTLKYTLHLELAKAQKLHDDIFQFTVKKAA